MKMQRSLTLTALMFVAVTAMIGSGWLFGPLYAVKLAGPNAIYAWVMGGALIFILALPFAELSTMFPVSGGLVRFMQFSHGPLVAFTMGLSGWYAAAIVAPIETLALLQYSANYIPHLMHSVKGHSVLTSMGVIVAIALLAFLCLINTLSARTVSKTNYFVVALKIATPLLTVIALIFTSFHASNFSFFSANSVSGHIKGMLSAIPNAGIVFSFLGFTTIIQLAGESKNPRRAILWSLCGSVTLCVVLYVLIQVAFIGAVNPAKLAHGWKYLSFVGDSGPFAGIATGLGLLWLVYILYADAIISPFGTALVYTASTARVNYAMTENDFMPGFMKKLNKKGVPIYALLVNFIFGSLVFLPFPGWQSMVGFLVSGFVFTYGVGPLALMVLRKKLPEQRRPFRLPFATIYTVISFYVGNLVLYWTGWHTLIKLLIFLMAGLILLGIYRLFSKKIGKKTSNMNVRAGLWLIPYLIGLGIISYLGSFGGGKGIIPFGIDFLVIFLFSTLIYYLAYRSAFLKGTMDTREFISRQVASVGAQLEQEERPA